MSHFETLSQNISGSDEEALQALASTSKVYGDRPDIAKHGDGEVSMPKPGHQATLRNSLMRSELGEKLAQESKRLLDPEASPKDMPAAHWDQALSQDEDKYAEFVDIILSAGLFELCLEIDEEVGLFFVSSPMGPSDCRWTHAGLTNISKQPPR